MHTTGNNCTIVVILKIHINKDGVISEKEYVFVRITYTRSRAQLRRSIVIDIKIVSEIFLIHSRFFIHNEFQNTEVGDRILGVEIFRR